MRLSPPTIRRVSTRRTCDLVLSRSEVQPNTISYNAALSACEKSQAAGGVGKPEGHCPSSAATPGGVNPKVKMDRCPKEPGKRTTLKEKSSVLRASDEQNHSSLAGPSPRHSME